jgi:hypothetical protein
VAGNKTLKEIYGSPQRGIVTGLNEAFIVDPATRDRLVREDAKSAELLKPFLEGKDLKRWRAESRDLWIIYVPKNTIDIDAFPAIKTHLLPFKEQLEKRATKQKWFELQQAQAAYVPAFVRTKISYPHFCVEPLFHLDISGALSNDKSYFIPSDSLALLAILNSNVAWYWLTGLAPPVRGGFYEFRVQYLETLPIPAKLSQGIPINEMVRANQSNAQSALRRERDFRRRIADLCPKGRDAKLSNKLYDWWELPNFAAFRAEVQKVFKTDIPVAERNQWEDLFKTGKAEIDRLTSDIERNERAINQIVYGLFDLTPAEIELLETSVR